VNFFPVSLGNPETLSLLLLPSSSSSCSPLYLIANPVLHSLFASLAVVCYAQFVGKFCHT
jgi:hypothetical protein